MSQITFTTVAVAELFEGDRLVDRRVTDNFLTETGEALIADRLSDLGSSAFSHMGIGTGSGGSRTSTALVTPVGTRDAFDSFTQGTGADDNDVIMVSTFAAGNPGSDADISEAAVFNASSSGTMVNYMVFNPPLHKLSSQSLVLTVTITCGYS